MLTDHRQLQERWAERLRRLRSVPRAYGYFLMGLEKWDWFVSVTFADRTPGSRPPSPEVALRRVTDYLLLIQAVAGHPIG